jgi:hypothetical protein
MTTTVDTKILTVRVRAVTAVTYQRVSTKEQATLVAVTKDSPSRLSGRRTAAKPMLSVPRWARSLFDAGESARSASDPSCNGCWTTSRPSGHLLHRAQGRPAGPQPPR